MKLIPMESFILMSKKSKQELEKELLENIEKQQLGKVFPRTNKPLMGTVHNNIYKVHNAINYQNSFQPIAIIYLSNRAGYGKLKVKLRMHRYTFFFMLVWFSFAIFCIFYIFYIFMFTEETEGFPFSILSSLIGIMLCGYTLMQLAFWGEVPKIKKILKSIVE